MADQKQPNLAQRLMAAGYKKSHAYQLAKETLTVPTAVKVFRRTGMKIGPITEATEDEIAVLEKFEDVRADGASA